MKLLHFFALLLVVVCTMTLGQAATPRLRLEPRLCRNPCPKGTKVMSFDSVTRDCICGDSALFAKPEEGNWKAPRL